MDIERDFPVENDNNGEPKWEDCEIDHHETIYHIYTKKQCTYRQYAQNHACYHRMCPEEHKSIWIFWISQEIDTVDDTGEKKYTIIE